MIAHKEGKIGSLLTRFFLAATMQLKGHENEKDCYTWVWAHWPHGFAHRAGE
jgi:hypothetical protein